MVTTTTEPELRDFRGHIAGGGANPVDAKCIDEAPKKPLAF